MSASKLSVVGLSDCARDSSQEEDEFLTNSRFPPRSTVQKSSTRSSTEQEDSVHAVYGGQSELNQQYELERFREHHARRNYEEERDTWQNT